MNTFWGWFAIALILIICGAAVASTSHEDGSMTLTADEVKALVIYMETLKLAAAKNGCA